MPQVKKKSGKIPPTVLKTGTTKFVSKRRFGLRTPRGEVTPRGWVNFVENRIRRHHAIGYSAKVKHFKTKDWMHPKVRADLQKVIETRLFAGTSFSMKQFMDIVSKSGEGKEPLVDFFQKQTNTPPEKSEEMLRTQIKRVAKNFEEITKLARDVNALKGDKRQEIIQLTASDSIAQLGTGGVLADLVLETLA